MDDDIRALLPHGKSDIARAQAIVAQDYPAVAPVLPELFEWLQDGNWPVSIVIGRFLASLGIVVINDVRKVLAGTDDVWKYWVIERVVGEAPELLEALHDDLWRLATNPSQGEHEQEVDRVALEALQKRHGLARTLDTPASRQ